MAGHNHYSTSSSNMTSGDPRGENNSHSNYSSNASNNTPAPNYSAGNGGGGGQAAAVAQATANRNMQAQIASAEAAQAKSTQMAALQAAQTKAIADTNFTSQALAKAPLSPFVSSLSNADAKPAVSSNPFISGLNNATDTINNYAANSMAVKALDAFFLNDGVSHPGYNDYQWDTRGGDGGARAAERDADKGPMTLREEFFSYQNTPDQQIAKDKANFLERQSIYQYGGGGEPMYNSKGQIIGYRDTDDNRVYSNEDRRDSSGKSLDNNNPDGVNGNMVGVAAPLSGVTYGNGFNGQRYNGGGNIGNYFSAIPDGIFNSGGSPPLMNIQTSYGNTYNGADQWTASGNATRAAQAAATTGES